MSLHKYFPKIGAMKKFGFHFVGRSWVIGFWIESKFQVKPSSSKYDMV